MRHKQRGKPLKIERAKGMRLSARNVLPGTVVAVVKGATTANVKIAVAGGSVITSSITNDAVDELDLTAGKKVSAVIKPSDVLVAPQA